MAENPTMDESDFVDVFTDAVHRIFAAGLKVGIKGGWGEEFGIPTEILRHYCDQYAEVEIKRSGLNADTLSIFGGKMFCLGVVFARKEIGK